MAARALIVCGARVSIVRLPPSVRGDGDHCFVPILIKIARDKNASVYLDSEANRWPAVHRLDAARVFKLALDNADHGAYDHAVAEEGVAFREIAEVIGRRLKVPVVGRSREEASGHFTWFAHFAALNISASSEQTQTRSGWRPTQLRLIADLDRPDYFT